MYTTTDETELSKKVEKLYNEYVMFHSYEPTVLECDVIFKNNPNVIVPFKISLIEPYRDEDFLVFDFFTDIKTIYELISRNNTEDFYIVNNDIEFL